MSPRADKHAGLVSPLTVLLGVLASVFAASALAVLGAYAPDLKSGDNGEAQVLSKSAIGFAGLARALRLEGVPVVVNRGPSPKAGDGPGLTILTPPPEATLAGISELGLKGPVLVVAPKWVASSRALHPGWVGGVELIPTTVNLGRDSLAASLHLVRAKGSLRPDLRRSGVLIGETPPRPGAVTAFQTIRATGWTPLITDAAGGVVLGRGPGRNLYVLSDPDLLDTQGLKSLDTLSTALALVSGLRRGDGPVIFDVRLNGLGRQRSLARLAFDPPFLGVTLCLAAAAALAGFQAFFRFGPARREARALAFGRAGLVDNTAALIRLAGREHQMGGRYADLTADLAARAVGAPRGAAGPARIALLDRLARGRDLSDTLSGLSEQARSAPTAEALAQVARRLYSWRRALSAAPKAP